MSTKGLIDCEKVATISIPIVFIAIILVFVGMFQTITYKSERGEWFDEYCEQYGARYVDFSYDDNLHEEYVYCEREGIVKRYFIGGKFS